jgi:AhpD family alkylhydroperoxidase
MEGQKGIGGGDQMPFEKSRSDKFAESLGGGFESAFKNLASQTLKKGALPAKDKALIALAASVAIRCEHCIQRHKAAALEAGASREEMLEAAAVAALVRMGSGLNSAALLLDEYD